MLGIQEVNHVGIRVREKTRSISFYGQLGFAFTTDAGFEQGHPIVMRHPSGVVLNLLGPANGSFETNILMDADEKHTGITHVALTVDSLEQTRETLAELGIEITGQFSFGGMSAVFIRDPDRNVIELDQFTSQAGDDTGDYSSHL